MISDGALHWGAAADVLLAALADFLEPRPAAASEYCVNQISESPISVCTLKIAAGAGVAGAWRAAAQAAGCGIQLLWPNLLRRGCAVAAAKLHKPALGRQLPSGAAGSAVTICWAVMLRAAMPRELGPAASLATSSLPHSQGQWDAVLAGQ